MAQVTEKNFKQFKKEYAIAVKEKKKSFIFDDQQVLVSYAKYLIEYMEDQIIVKKYYV